MIKNIFIGIAVTILLLSGLVIYNLSSHGYFSEVTVVEETIPAMTVITAKHTGPYPEVGPIMGKLYDEAKAAGISKELIRMSVGLEHIDDIIEDIEQALDKSK